MKHEDLARYLISHFWDDPYDIALDRDPPTFENMGQAEREWWLTHAAKLTALIAAPANQIIEGIADYLDGVKSQHTLDGEHAKAADTEHLTEIVKAYLDQSLISYRQVFDTNITREKLPRTAPISILAGDRVLAMGELESDIATGAYAVLLVLVRRPS